MRYVRKHVFPYRRVFEGVRGSSTAAAEVRENTKVYDKRSNNRSVKKELETSSRHDETTVAPSSLR